MPFGPYDQRLVEVTGFVTRGFENFTLFDPACTSSHDVWLEYGGTADGRRAKPLTVEDTLWGGYGHLGCCSLLAIQQVLSVEPQQRETGVRSWAFDDPGGVASEALRKFSNAAEESLTGLKLASESQ